jgi:Holliday junction resolvasome RuvABC endonuclease subunit
MNRTKQSTSKRLVLANDPSMTAWGWVVIDPTENTVVDCGTIKTETIGKKMRIRKGDDRVRRIQEINVALRNVLDKYNVSLIVSELPHGSQSAVAAIMIGVTTGIMQTIGACHGIPVEWFSEGDAKMAIAQKRTVEKDEMVTIVAGFYPDVKWTGVKWRDQAVADALAVYYVAWRQSTALKMLATSN